MDERPIGIFDSGLGGLTVLKELLNQLPNENYIYFGDTARVPYGNKSQETIVQFSQENIDFLKQFNVKAIVFACHTASCLALEHLQRTESLPLFGMIDSACNKAVESTTNSRIAVLGTKSTTKSMAYQKKLMQIRSNLKIYSQSCPLFVPLIEEGWHESKITEDVIHIYLNDLRSYSVDTMILGCTHYPIIGNLIDKFFDHRVNLVNPAYETAGEIKRYLDQNHLRTAMNKHSDIQFFVSDEVESFKKLGKHFLEKELENVRISNRKQYQ